MELNQSAREFKALMGKKYGTMFTDTITDYQITCILAYIAEGIQEQEETDGEELERFHRD